MGPNVKGNYARTYQRYIVGISRVKRYNDMIVSKTQTKTNVVRRTLGGKSDTSDTPKKSWSIVGVPLEYQWSIVEVPLEYQWSILEVPLEYHWSTSGVPLEYGWSIVGVRVEYHWSIVGVPLEYHWSIKGVPWKYHWSTIKASSEYLSTISV